MISISRNVAIPCHSFSILFLQDAVWLVVWNMAGLFFHIGFMENHPNWLSLTPSFFRGVGGFTKHQPAVENWPSRPTVDERNPTPVDRWFIPLFIRFQPSKVVQDFFHQQYQGCELALQLLDRRHRCRCPGCLCCCSLWWRHRQEATEATEATKKIRSPPGNMPEMLEIYGKSMGIILKTNIYVWEINGNQWEINGNQSKSIGNLCLSCLGLVWLGLKTKLVTNLFGSTGCRMSPASTSNPGRCM